MVALGEPWIALGIALVTVLAAWEVFRLLRAAGYATFPGLGTVFALAVVADAAAPTLLAGSGLLLAAIGLILIGAGALQKADPRDGLATWSATVFGAFYVSLLVFVVRLGAAVPPLPPEAPVAWLGAERGWIGLLVLGVWAFDTGAYLVGRQFGRRKFMQHISPSKTVEGFADGPAGEAFHRLGRWKASPAGPSPRCSCARSCSGCLASRSSERSSWARWLPPRRRPATWLNRCSSAPPVPRTPGR